MWYCKQARMNKGRGRGGLPNCRFYKNFTYSVILYRFVNFWKKLAHQKSIGSGILIFCKFGAHEKFPDPMTTPFIGESKWPGKKKKKRKKNNPKNNGHYIPLHCPRAAHAPILEATRFCLQGLPLFNDPRITFSGSKVSFNPSSQCIHFVFFTQPNNLNK